MPTIALSVRQPWAWAIIHGGKTIENRTEGAIRSGGMTTGRIAIHAATGMRQKEYLWGLYKLNKIGVRCPDAGDLPRGAIIGSVDVVDIVSESDSPWFGGPFGLVLKNPVPCTPIPAKGALGYFSWRRADGCAPSAAWMTKQSPTLFDDLPPAFASAPAKPFGSRKD